LHVLYKTFSLMSGFCCEKEGTHKYMCTKINQGFSDIFTILVQTIIVTQEWTVAYAVCNLGCMSFSVICKNVCTDDSVNCISVKHINCLIK